MEKEMIDRDIKVFYIEASSFPNGVMSAHQQLHKLVPKSQGRQFYGISFGSPTGAITYRAAVEELYNGEAEKLECKTFIIKKGAYISETLVDWCNDETSVGKTFHKLLTDSRLDKNGYCVEVYLNETDMKCMVKIND